MLRFFVAAVKVFGTTKNNEAHFDTYSTKKDITATMSKGGRAAALHSGSAGASNPAIQGLNPCL